MDVFDSLVRLTARLPIAAKWLRKIGSVNGYWSERAWLEDIEHPLMDPQ